MQCYKREGYIFTDCKDHANWNGPGSEGHLMEQQRKQIWDEVDENVQNV